MAQGKIQFKVGNLEFLGEGEEKWLADQLDKLIEKIPSLVKISPAATSSGGAGKNDLQDENGIDTKEVPLATFLKEKNIGDSHVNRFLATAIWLHGRGNKTPNTSDVNKALRDNHQPKLNNASDCLSKNVAKGFCEKQDKHFFITPNGFSSIK